MLVYQRVTSIPRKKLSVCHYLDDDVILDVAKSSGNTKAVTSLLIISYVSWEVSSLVASLSGNENKNPK